MEGQNSKTLLTLGDSYTIGECVEPDDRWSMQLKGALKGTIDIADPMIIATTGWTTTELLEGIKKAGISDQKYDYVSLLIGVNNQYRGEAKGFTLDLYQHEFSQLLKMAISFAGGRQKGVFVLSIPDWSVTPFAKENNTDKVTVAREIDRYNNVAKEICINSEVDYFDITQITRMGEHDASLIASDGLHPSARMYNMWSEVVKPWFE